MIRTIYILLLAFIPACATSAQAPDPIQSLRQSLVKQQLFLRDYSAENKIAWQWQSGSFVHVEPKVHILSALKIDGVKLKGSALEITGSRYALLRQDDKQLTLADLNEPVTIRVDLTGADLATALPALPNLLFFANLKEALASLPAEYKTVLPAKLNGPCCSAAKPAPAPPGTQCDCAAPKDQQCSERSVGFTPPKLIHSADPEFTDEARGHRPFKASLSIGIQVGIDGHPADMWIVKPTAFHLDENATKAVLQYVFAPAACHGQPQQTQIYVDVAFDID